MAGGVFDPAKPDPDQDQEKENKRRGERKRKRKKGEREHGEGARKRNIITTCYFSSLYVILVLQSSIVLVLPLADC